MMIKFIYLIYEFETYNEQRFIPFPGGIIRSMVVSTHDSANLDSNESPEYPV